METKSKKRERITSTEGFVKKLKEIFKDEDYDFSKTVFNGREATTTVHCNKHNIDLTKQASTFLLGCGCHLCKRSGHKYSSEEWVLLAKEKYPKYGYNLVDYQNKKTKVKIWCYEKDENGIEHGEFEVRPNRFLVGLETCPKCRKEKLLQEKKDKYMFQLVDEYEDEDYDFSKANYKNNHTPIEVRCRKHDYIWNPTPNNMLTHHCLCPKCQREKQIESLRLSFDEIKQRLEKQHPSLDFSLFKEQQQNEEAKISCICHEKDENNIEHGIFEKTIHLLLQGQGCPKCGRKQAGLKTRLEQSEFLERIKEKHKGKKFDFSEAFYIKGEKNVKIICKEKDKQGKEHGAFNIKASYLLKGYGCPKCRKSHLEYSLECFLNENNIEHIPQKRFKWLGKQSLDFYLPQYNIGIECQGSQHFISDFFLDKGKEYAEELLRKTQKRDERKKTLCSERGITLIYFLSKSHIKYMTSDSIYFTELGELLKHIKSCPQPEKIQKKGLDN